MTALVDRLIEQLKVFYKNLRFEKVDEETLAVAGDGFTMKLVTSYDEDIIREYSTVTFDNNLLDGTINDVFANNERLKESMDLASELFEDFVSDCIYAYDYDDEDF